MEAVTASLMDLGKLRRKLATFLAALLVAVLSIPAVLSYGVLSSLRLSGRNMFALVDFLSGNISLPIGALLLALYTAVVWRFPQFQKDVNVGSSLVSVGNWWRVLGG